MLQDPFTLPSCFSSAAAAADPFDVDLSSAKPGHTIVSSIHTTKLAGHTRLITVSWLRNLLAHGLSISIQTDQANNATDNNDFNSTTHCKVELKPWCFWRKQGSKKFDVDGSPVKVFWDLRRAHFSGESEPRSGYYVALVHDNEIALLLGDSDADAFKRTGCRPSTIEPTFVMKKEHVFGKKRFLTKTKLHERGRYHEVLIECGSSGIGGKLDPQMMVKIDGQVVVHVKHLQWKFRGNETITVNKGRVEVYWDVHDWLFSPGMRHALFIFKPLPAVHSSLLSGGGAGGAAAGGVCSGGAGYCLFLYAWKIE